jgi:hypothetical protein
MVDPVSSIVSQNSTAAVARTSATQTETKAPVVAKKDQVNISNLAQKLASDGDTQAQEVKESGAEKTSETARKKA